MKLPLPLFRCLALVLGLLLRLAPARAQALAGTFAAGNAHSLSIHADGTLWATGDNRFGQLGTGNTTATSAWVQVGTAANWVQVAVGTSYSLGLRADGTLWAWGLNRYGQLGLPTTSGTVDPSSTPTQVGTDRYTQVAAGDSHSLALRADGTLWAWGSNYYGQLGRATNMGTYTPSPTLAQVGTDRYTQVVAGYGHSLGLRADGTLLAWGDNILGQLGQGTSSGGIATPTRVGTALYAQVAAGNNHVLALRADGTLYAWGLNYYGELGTPAASGTVAPNPTPTRVGTDLYTHVAAGTSYSLALRPGGALYAWGANNNGQLGIAANSGSTVPNPTPTRVGTDLYTHVAAGYGHSLGLRADGTLLAWGTNSNGQLGSTRNAGTATPNPTPTATGTALPTRSTAAGNNFGLAVRPDGTLWAWGDNTYGQLGDGTTTASLVPKQVGTARDWVMVAAGLYHGLGLKADGTLWAWGANDFGQLGNPTNTGTRTANSMPTQVGTERYTQVAAGSSHSLGLRADGTLYAWGCNTYGQLGNATNAGTNTPTSTPTQVGTAQYTRLAGGFQHSLGLRPDGTLWTWGYNISGQLGNGGTNVVNATPTQVGTAVYAHLAAGGYHSLGLRADGTLYAWGANYNGQLGDGVAGGTTTLTPRQVGTDIYAQVAAGQLHSLGLRANGTLYTWGHNGFGELGNGTTDTGGLTSYPTPVQEATAGTGWATLATGATSFSSLVRTASGLSFASAGYNTSGQLGDGTTTNANRFDRLRPLGSLQQLPVLAAGSPVPGLRLYPNPAPGRATALHGAAPGAAVLVLDALGRPVLATAADAAGTATLLLPTGLAAGVYLVRTGRQALRLSVE